MIIPALGNLRQHADVPEWMTSDPVAVPYFDGLKLVFILDSIKDSDEADAVEAVIAFLKLGPEDRLLAGRYVFANYLRIAGLVDEEDLGCSIGSVAEVWKHVQPTEFIFANAVAHSLSTC